MNRIYGLSVFRIFWLHPKAIILQWSTVTPYSNKNQRKSFIKSLLVHLENSLSKKIVIISLIHRGLQEEQETGLTSPKLKPILCKITAHFN